MAYYHPACVERIALIKQAQTRHRLPLAAIKSMLKEKDAALALALARMARSLRAYVIDRIMQKRLIALKGLKNRKS